MSLVDQTYLRALNEKDEVAFEVFFRAWFTPLLRYAQSIVRDPEVAREIVQELFLSLWSREDAFPADMNLRSYLFTSIRNRSLNTLRQQQVRDKYTRQNPPAVSEQGFEQWFPDPFLEEKIRAAVNSLPDQCRTVFQLSRYQHLKNREIADQLGISLKAVEKQIGRALKHLRQYLKEYLPLLLVAMVYR